MGESGMLLLLLSTRLLRDEAVIRGTFRLLEPISLSTPGQSQYNGYTTAAEREPKEQQSRE